MLVASSRLCCEAGQLTRTVGATSGNVLNSAGNVSASFSMEANNKMITGATSSAPASRTNSPHVHTVPGTSTTIRVATITTAANATAMP